MEEVPKVGRLAAQTQGPYRPSTTRHNRRGEGPSSRAPSWPRPISRGIDACTVSSFVVGPYPREELRNPEGPSAYEQYGWRPHGWTSSPIPK